MRLDLKSGEAFDPLADPIDLEGIHLEDIAHALSLQCRFMGHCRVFYSEAQHGLEMAHYLEWVGYPGSEASEERRDRMLACLLWKAPGVYLPTPSRAFPVSLTYHDHPRRSILQIQAVSRLETALAARFGLDPMIFNEPALHFSSKSVLAAECRDLMPPTTYESFRALEEIEAIAVNPARITAMSPVEAKVRYLSTFETLWKR